MSEHWSGKRFKREIKINNSINVFDYLIIGVMLNGKYKIQMSFPIYFTFK